MSLPAGARFGPYEILAPLGAGGMGEVYRARDAKLNRDVALKVLPAAFARDPDRLARFDREAQVLAALNHPNIAQIHRFEEAQGVGALVMELIDGPTLADRLAGGVIPEGEALPIARQIAEALEAAHEQGVIHRDLKPANIKVRADGTVKVLDFGLAKVIEPGPAATTAAQAATLSMHATAVGTVLGTAAYMSPEQARGQVVDRRADIWAFGCVLFEMLAGRRAFDGASTPDLLASILTEEPDWRALPGHTPAGIVRLLRRCLVKSPKARLDSAAAARFEIDDAMAPRADGDVRSPAAEQPLASRVWVPAAAAAVAALAAGLGVWAVLGSVTPSAPPVNRFAISLPPAQSLTTSVNDRDIAIARDGRLLVYTAGADAQIMARSFEQLAARPLPGIVNARAPFLSPDGRWVGFFSRREEGLNSGPVEAGSLRKASTTGGPPITICALTGTSRGASWAADDTIVFATNDPTTGLLRVAAAGGEPVVLTTPDTSKGERDHYFPSTLPGGGVLFTVHRTDGNAQDVAVLDGKTGDRRILIRGGRQAEYVETGHLLYTTGDTLWAVPFDVDALATRGDPAPVVEGILSTTSAANVTVSRNGTLVYAPRTVGGRTNRLLSWVGRDGRAEPIAAPARRYVFPRLSPDGTRVVVRVEDPEGRLWILRLDRNTLTPLTSEERSFNAAWSPDGRSIVFNRGQSSVLFRRPLDGSGPDERLTPEPGTGAKIPTSVSPDGTRLVFHEYPQRGNAAPDIMLLRMDGPPRIEPLLQTPADERDAEISPDGRWLAYDSTVSGRAEIYVRPFPDVHDGLHQISTGGGRTPVWSPDGRELFFVNDGRLMAVSVRTSPALIADEPTVLLDDRSLLLDARTFATGAHRTFDVSRDGQRFLVITDGPSAADDVDGASLVVVQNWFGELMAKLSSGR